MRLEPLEDRLRSVFAVNHFFTGLLTTKPDDVAAVQNDRFMNVCDGTSQNQWSNTPKSRAIPSAPAPAPARTRS